MFQIIPFKVKSTSKPDLILQFQLNLTNYLSGRVRLNPLQKSNFILMIKMTNRKKSHLFKNYPCLNQGQYHLNHVKYQIHLL